MTLRPALFLSLAFPLLLSAQDATPADDAPGPKEIALDNLLSERGSKKALDEMIAAAKKNGVSDQAILEARFLYHVDMREDDAIAAMLPEFLSQDKVFKIRDSAIFVVKEDWMAVLEYVQAIASLKKGDKTAFKTHITEAFWLSPRQAAAFAPHIDRLRLEETMKDVKMDFSAKYAPMSGGDAVSLEAAAKKRKAMILHFWSPGSRDSEASLPDYATTAKTLVEKGIAMVSMVPDNDKELLEEAVKMIKPLGEKPPGAWLVDSKDEPLARELRVQTLPIFVLVSNEGKVIFNGDPSDDVLWDELKKIDASIARPDSPLSE